MGVHVTWWTSYALYATASIWLYDVPSRYFKDFFGHHAAFDNEHYLEQKRRWREDRDRRGVSVAEKAYGFGSPSPLGRGLERGLYSLSITFLNLDLQIKTLDAFWVLFHNSAATTGKFTNCPFPFFLYFISVFHSSISFYFAFLSSVSLLS